MIHSIHKYYTPRKKKLTKEEAEVRDIAYALADKQQFDDAAFMKAAEAMADVLRKKYVPPINLVPIPDHTGSSGRNLALCKRIVDILAVGVYTQDILERPPFQSRSGVNKLEGAPPEPSDMHIRVKKNKRSLSLKNTLLVDNVVTTGTTYLACSEALERVSLSKEPDLLVWADARDTVHQMYHRV